MSAPGDGAGDADVVTDGDGAAPLGVAAAGLPVERWLTAIAMPPPASSTTTTAPAIHHPSLCVRIAEQ